MFEPTQENATAIAELIGRGAAEVLRTEDFAALRCWVASEGPALVPALFAEATSERGLRAGANAIAISVWNASPLPSNGYRSRPLPAPGRNDPCSCGSGDKFKRCCGQISSEFPRVPEEDAWRLLAGHLTNDDLARCVNDPALPPEPLALLAGELRERGADEGARAALEQRLARPEDLDGRHAQALDLFLDLESGAREFEDFVGYAYQLVERLPQPLQATVYRHLVSAAILAREFDEAHELLDRMRAADPDDPALGPLEVTVLLSAGEYARAAERARFWLAWLRRRDLHEEMPGAIEMLEQAVRDPEAAAREFRADEYPFLDELAEIVARAVERPARPYALDTADEGSVLARPPRGVRATEQAWRGVWPDHKPLLVSLDVEPPAGRIEDPEPWLDVLREHADALDSLDVLDDLVLFVRPFVEALDPGWDGPLLAPLLARAADIVRVSLAPLGAGARVPWGFPQNRLALRLLSGLGGRLERLDRRDEAAAVYEEVLRWNPADNHGHRGWLVNHFLRAGDDTRALEFAQHFSDDDLVETNFGRALALWRLGRRTEAEAALRAAAADHPRVVTALVAAEMQEPDLTPGFVEVEGEDEAWFYREEMREAWLATPEALVFLGGLAKPSAGRRRRAPRERR